MSTPNVKIPRLVRCLVFGVLFILIGGSAANAQTNGTWSALNGGNWFTTGNWVSGTVANGGLATFTNSGAGTATINGGLSLTGLTFTTNASAYTIAASSGFYLQAANSGLVIQTSGTGANSETLSTAVYLRGGSTGVTFTNNYSSSSNILTFSGAVEGNANGTNVLTLNGTNTGANKVGGIVSDTTGTTALTKSGTGNWILSGANTYSGGTTISAGTLQAGNATAFGTGKILFTGGTLQFASGITHDFSSQFSTTNSQAYSVDTNGQNVTFATALTSSGGSLALYDTAGTGSLTLTKNNTYTGATTINAGAILDLADTSAAAISSTNSITVNGGTLNLTGGSHSEINSAAIVTVTNSGIFNFGSANQTLAGVVNKGGTVNYGTGTTVINDPAWTTGTNTVSGNTTFSAGLTVSGGTNTITGTNSGGTGFLILDTGAGSTAGGALTFSGTGSPNITVNSDSTTPGTLQAQGNIYDTDTTGTASISNGLSQTLPGKLDLDTSGSARGVNVSSGGTLNIGTKIVDSGSNSGVTINSASGYTGTQGGTVVFSASSTYTGPTTVNGGTLDVTGALTTSTTTVASGGILQGDGTVGAVKVQSGGTLTPGDAFTLGPNLTSTNTTNNILTAGNLTLSGGATLSYNLYHAKADTGTVSDPAGGTLINLSTGFFDSDGTVSPTDQIVLNFNETAASGIGTIGHPIDPNVYTLVEFGSGATNLTTSDFKIENLNPSLMDSNSAYLAFTTVGVPAGEEALQLYVVPEPSTWTLVLSGLAALAYWRTRQPRGSKTETARVKLTRK